MENKEGDCFWDIFYLPFKNIPISTVQIDKTFRDNFLKLIPDPPIPLRNDTLVMHIRSGDIWKEHHPQYGQPNCQYFLDVMHMKKWSEVIIVSENRNNICIDLLEKEGAIFKKRKLFEDLAILFNTKNLVLSRGSFFFPIVSFRTVEFSNLYTFDNEDTQAIDHFNCVPTTNYKRNVLDYWKNDRTQRKLMLTEKCEKWEIVRANKNKEWRHLNVHAYL